MCSLFIELVASTEWEHLWENLVIASPGKSWKVPNEVGLWIAMFPGEGSATIINPWNLAGCSSCAPWKNSKKIDYRSSKILENMSTNTGYLCKTSLLQFSLLHNIKELAYLCEISRTLQKQNEQQYEKTPSVFMNSNGYEIRYIKMQ